MQAAGKFFKKFFSSAELRRDGSAWNHRLYDIRLHRITNKAIDDDSFERAIMRPLSARDVKWGPQDYQMTQISVFLAGIEAQSDHALGWHQKGREVLPPR